MRGGLHEALKQIAAGERPAGLEALVAALRRFEEEKPGAGVDALCHLLDVYPDLRTALRATLRDLLSDETAATLYAEAGILANTGFFTELGRRLLGRVLPAPRDLTLRGQFGALFDSGDDAAWLEHIPVADGARIMAALRLDDDELPARIPARHVLLDAIDLLSVRVAAMGVEPELQRHYRVPREHNNPFLAQNAVLQAWLSYARTTTQTDSAHDASQALVLLAQCHDVAERVRRSARSGGASLNLTFLLRRLQQSLTRMHTLLAVATEFGNDDDAAIARRVALGIELALADGNAHDIHEHLRESAGLLALLATENASRVGEHYVTRTRSEYFAMFRAALGAGGIVGLMAIIKMMLGSLQLPPLVEALAFSLNYSFGFVLIYVLHFSIATKQPAMTAQTLAASLSSSNTKHVDTDAVSLLVSRVSRTQFIAVLGNLLLAVPIALLIALAMHYAGATTPAHKAPLLLADLNPFASAALFHAAIAGVWLCLAGLVTGYVDNLAAYERLADRVRRMRWLESMTGNERREQFAIWLENNLGGIAGNIFFGFALGMTGFVGTMLGLPLDIRHVTFAAANLAIAVAGTDFAIPTATIVVAGIGVLLIALVNLAVSFALALWIALRARGEHIENTATLLAALWRRFRAAPLAFLWPPRDDEPRS